MDDEPTIAGGRSPLSDPRPLNDLPDGNAELAWAMVDASPDALVMVDEGGLIELVNQQTEVMFGYDRGELLGRPVEILLPEESVAVHRAHRTRYRAAPEVRAMGTGMELWARRADGSEIPVEISLSPLLAGGTSRVIAAVRDVSDRRTAEAAARRLERGIDAIAVGVYLVDPLALRFVYVNHGATVQTGFGVEELLEMGPQHFSAEFTTEEVVGLFAPLIEGSTTRLRFETIMRPRSGHDFPVEATVEYPDMGKDQDKVLVMVVRDISERVSAEEHARLIQHSIDSVSDAVFMCDEHTLAFIYVNQGAVDLNGYSRTELLGGMTPTDLAPTLPLGDLEAMLEHLARAPTESGRLRAEGHRKDGTTMPVEVQINWPASAREGGPRPVMAVVRDISDQAAHEAALASSEARFRAAFGAGPVPMTIIEVSPPDIRAMIDVNQALADLFGYSREELIGRPAADLIHAADVHPDATEALAAAAGKDVEYASLVRGIRKDGTEIWLQRHIGALDPDGEHNKLIVHVVDVTAEIEADLTRRRQQTLTAALSNVRLEMLQGAARAQGLKLICESARDLLDGVGALVLTPTGNDDLLGIEASAGVPDSIKAKMSFRTTQGGVGEVFQSGQPRYLNQGRHATTPEENRAVLNQQHVGPTLMAPLPGSDGAAGVLIVVRLNDGAPFSDADLDPIQQFAAGAVSAIDLAEARANEATLELLQDRDRIGRDMHDNVIGRLFGTGMSLQAVMSHVGSQEAVTERLGTAVEDIDTAIRDIRTSIYGVRSSIDWGKGVRGQILAAAADHSDALDFEPAINLEGPIDDLPPATVDHLLAVVSEALTNIAKYAKATSASLAITANAHTLTAEITDDGVGFSATGSGPNSDSALTGYGLRNIVSRAEALGGTAEVVSDAGKGTTVIWAVPLH